MNFIATESLLVFTDLNAIKKDLELSYFLLVPVLKPLMDNMRILILQYLFFYL